ncbi:flagellar brake protein [Undibacterium sp. Jales W-56]|uniref:flagellar brake protein n=1 Tax=Undibacterium sp. Jales W-56 TaxID=2897325 RepID=UPI0021D0D49B|nr:flagellar brake protein [Undibacterium sp. Jales W-56]MCU6433767.1 flagellar brake protein [Undibacterium sp. Jales W-56]
MNELSSLIPIKKTEVKVGQATPWPVYDAWGNLLLESGSIVRNEQQLNDLVENGYCSDTLWADVGKKNSPAAINKAETAPERPASELTKEAMIELDSVRWHVGEIFYLQVHDNANLRYTVRLIGFVKNKSIMVTAPMIEGKGALVRDGQTFIVRAFPGKKAYAFTASAMKSVFSPHAYLHLSYPKQVRSTTIRQNSRASVKIIAAVTIGEPEQTAAATLGDLSMGGTSGVIKKPLGKKNDIGTIKFKVNAAGNDEYLVLKIILRSVSPTETGDEYRHGFEFIEVPTQAKLILSAFVHQTLAETE